MVLTLETKLAQEHRQCDSDTVPVCSIFLDTSHRYLPTSQLRIEQVVLTVLMTAENPWFAIGRQSLERKVE
jgi:hypothetical protein